MKIRQIIEAADHPNIVDHGPRKNRQIEAKLYAIKFNLRKICNILAREDPDLVAVGHSGGLEMYHLMVGWAQTQGEDFTYKMVSSDDYLEILAGALSVKSLRPYPWPDFNGGRAASIFISNEHPYAQQLYDKLQGMVDAVEAQRKAANNFAFKKTSK